jgi:soluble lytic murein transglycosylase
VIVPTALWAAGLAAIPMQPRDPLLELSHLAEVLAGSPDEEPLRSGDLAGAEARIARLEKNSDLGAALLADLQAAVTELHLGPTAAPARPPEVSGPEAEMLAARAEHTLGNEAEARAHWQHVADSGDPGLAAEASIAWARSAESTGDVEGALRRLAGLAGDPHHGAEAEYLAGRMELQHGRTDEAIASFSSAASKKRQRFSDEARWWLGWAQFGAGRLDPAAAEWASLPASWPRSPLIPQALYWRARALELSGKDREAGAIRDRIAAAAPGSYYAVLADRDAPWASGIHPDRCAADRHGASDAFRVASRRAALFQALGLSAFADVELEVAARAARGPVEKWWLAQLDVALGASGRAFSLFNGGAAACLPTGWPSTQLYPRVAPGEVGSAARAVGIDPLWIYALMRRESRFEPTARSPAGAVGLLQMLPVTGARIASVAGVARPDLADPSDSIWFGAWYLGALSERFGGAFALVAAGYDAGPAPVTTWLEGDRRFDEFVEQIPFRETRAYVKEAVANLAAYQALYGPTGLRVSAESRLGSGPSSGVSF